MTEHVYVKKGDTVWHVPMSVWIGVCKDGSRGADYAFPEECIVPASEASNAIDLSEMGQLEFQSWVDAHQRGEVPVTKPEPIVPKKVDPLVNPQDHWIDTNPVIIEAPAKKPRGKKK